MWMTGEKTAKERRIPSAIETIIFIISYERVIHFLSRVSAG